MTKEQATRFAQQAVNKARINIDHESKRKNIPKEETETLKAKLQYALLVQKLVFQHFQEKN